VAAIFTPATINLFSYEPALDTDLGLPPYDPVLLATQQLRDSFGDLFHASTLSVLVEADPHCKSGVRSARYFANVCGIAHSLLNLSRPDRPVLPSNLLGIAFYKPPGNDTLQCIPWRTQFQNMGQVQAAWIGNSVPSGHLLLTGRTITGIAIPGDVFAHFHRMYGHEWANLVSSDEQASLIIARLPWDTMSKSGFALIEDMRNLLSGSITPRLSGACSGVRAWEISATSVYLDFFNAAVGSLPRVGSLALVLTTPCVLLYFCSVLATLKLLLTVILPMTWVYGISVWYFRDEGTLADTGSAGLHWSVPCGSSCFLLALGLDYNIYYFGRVYEFRKAGLSDLESLRHGLASTGPVITCAGIIFALEFTGALLSEAPLHQQVGFVIIVGVLLDTFVVRSCLVPAALSIGASWNWWPATMPDPNLEMEKSIMDKLQKRVV